MHSRSRWTFGGILFLVGTFAFAVGYIVRGEAHRAPIIIEACASGGSAPRATTTSSSS